MGIQENKITDYAISQHGVVAAPDRLVGTPQENKRVFDRLIREVVQGMFNGLIDALLDSSAAAEIGARVEDVAGTTVQAVLGSLKTLIDSKVASADMTAALSLKADTSVTDKHVKDVEFDAATGKFRFVKQSGSVVEFDTALEKVATNWVYDAAEQSLVLTLVDGTTQRVSLSDFITLTEFVSSDSIEFSVSGQKVTARIKPGGVTDAMLNSTLKEMLQGYVLDAARSANFAEQHENAAREQAVEAEKAAAAAEQSKSAAKTAETSANAAASDAESAAGDARRFLQRAEAAASMAQLNATLTEDSRIVAEQAAQRAVDIAEEVFKSEAEAKKAQELAESARDEAAELVANMPTLEKEVLCVEIDEFDAPNATYAEIKAAYDQGYFVFVREEDTVASVLPLVKCFGNEAVFERADIEGGAVYRYVVTPDGSNADYLYDGYPITPEMLGLSSENWTFTLEDGSTVTKAVYVG